MLNKGFEGWYFKHQKGNDAVSFIPGVAEDGAFIQMICKDGSRQFDVPSLSVNGSRIRAGDCCFSPYGCNIELPHVRGKIRYGPLTPLRSDIMGPFRFLPMECRHGVFSMAHTLTGTLTIDGKSHCFDGGTGYIEKDSGISFPRSYLWVQCNEFTQPCSIMLSIADIPFCGLHFTGCICAVIHGGREYRFATYYGVRIHAANAEYVRLSEGKLMLELDMAPSRGAYSLRSPVSGQMVGAIREALNAKIHARLWKNGEMIFDLYSNHAAYESVSQY